MKKLISLVLAFVLLFSLAGCSQEKEGDTDDKTPTDTQQPADQDNKGDEEKPNGEGEANTITVAAGAQFTTFDPAMNTEAVNSAVLTHLYSGLFRQDADAVPQKELCEDYTVSEDGKTYTFTLKKDLKWSDGSPLTAYDFEYSYLRALSFGADAVYNMTTMCNYVEGATEYQERALEAGDSFDCTKEDHSDVGIAALDELTFQLKLKSPCPHLLQLLCSYTWTAVPQSTPQHEGLWSFEGGYPTSGPFTLAEANSTEKAVLVKNPNYWNADKVTCDELTYLVMTDRASQLLSFQKGDIDVALSVSIEDAASYSGTDSLWSIENASSYFLAINSGSTGPEWAKDPKVRKALALAIDRDAITDVLSPDFYEPLYGLVPYGCADAQGDFRTNRDSQPYEIKYDPEQAKTLLAQAGYDDSNPLTIVYKYSNNSIHGDVATMLEQFWSAIGVQVQFESVESGVFYDQLDAGSFEIARYGYNSSIAMQQLQIWTTENQIVAAVDDQHYNDLYEETLQIADTEKYFEGVHALEDYLIQEQTYLVPMFNQNNAVLRSTDFEGYTTNASTPFFAYIHH